MAKTNPIALRFIQPIARLKILENLGEGVSFSPLYYLTNDKVKISKLIEPDITDIMGKYFRHSALDSAAVIYLEGDIAMEGQNSTELSVDYFVWECIGFLLALWIVKDHAITLLPAILRISPSNESPKYLILTFGHRNFNATGSSSEVVEFSCEEIRIAGEYYQDWIVKLTKQTANKISPRQVSFVETNFDKTSTRLFRFLWFLEHARKSSDIGIKLGLFCSCLECLFSSENEKQEVTHKVAEKTAFFLETIPSQRKAIFKQIKVAYDLRSSVLHGGTIDNKKLLRLEPVCIQTDDLLRKVFSKILKSKSTEPDFFKMFTAEENQLQEFLSDLLFQADVSAKSQESVG
jgi:hypothetical protein